MSPRGRLIRLTLASGEVRLVNGGTLPLDLLKSRFGLNDENDSNPDPDKIVNVEETYHNG